MLRNLTISPELDKEDWDPDVITRMIIIAPGAHVSESEIVNELHMLDFLEILEDAEATDLDQEKVSTKWKMNTDYLVMWQMLWKIPVM